MARNEEKHYCRLNRLILQQQKEDELKKNPKRPKLITLGTAEEVKQWLPSIKKDLNFNLMQMEVPCYPDRKIKEFQEEINRLKKEYRSFVQKLKTLNPNEEIVPWKERAYGGKRKHDNVDKTADSLCDPAEIKTAKFQRIALPIMASELEKKYAQEKEIENKVVIVPNVNMDLPLEFKSESCHRTVSKKPTLKGTGDSKGWSKSFNSSQNLNDSNCYSKDHPTSNEDLHCDPIPARTRIRISPDQLKKTNLLCLDYSSDSNSDQEI